MNFARNGIEKAAEFSVCSLGVGTLDASRLGLIDQMC